MNEWLWLLVIIPSSGYLGYVYSNYRWRKIIRTMSRPQPNPYRELGVCRTCGYAIRPLRDHGWEHVGNHGMRLHVPVAALDTAPTEGGK